MLIVIKKLRSYLSVGIISRLKYHLNIENLFQIYHTLIESQIRYGIMDTKHLFKKYKDSAINLLSLLIKTNMVNLFSFFSYIIYKYYQQVRLCTN